MKYTTEEQLSVTHINNLIKASELSHFDIIFTNSGTHYQHPEANLTINEEDRTVTIDLYNDYAEEVVSLKDFRYIIGCLSIQ